MQATADQILKDFGMTDTEIRFSGNAAAAYDELFAQVLPIVGKLVTGGRQALLQTLYRVDLKESEAQTQDPETLTELIIKRELQKVVTKKLFGS